MTTQKRLSAHDIKKGGVHYTPPELARFLAAHVVRHLPKDRPLRILDPACGDGELLEAIAVEIPEHARRHVNLFGMEHDSSALANAHDRLSHTDYRASLQLIEADFLDWSRDFNQPGIFSRGDWAHSFDAVIANPPYVRTQVMGSHYARRLAAQFNISGRVDLYHAFALAMTAVLKEEGILGLLCSNRFLSVISGATLREVLLSEYKLHDVFDLGDTKLFEAAVLPAIVIGAKQHPALQDCRFTRIYEANGAGGYKADEFPSVLEAVSAGAEGRIRVGSTLYDVERGKLAEPANATEPWRITSPDNDHWLSTVKKNAPLTFADLVRIRVGIKTTADNVFIRDDWERLPLSLQPEQEVLRPLVGRDSAAQWWASPSKRNVQVLYTHTIEDGKRIPIDLSQLPRAKKYLERHKAQLISRKYVVESGRNWYEIWVPQDPDSWRKPKIVFPDISPRPLFFLDETGSVVDGNCYWFTADEPEYLCLLLAIANSSFILPFYDAVCGNRLYAGRRRFLTQYVQRFPVPNPDSLAAQDIILVTQRLLAERTQELALEADEAVWAAMGLSRKTSLAEEFAVSR